MNSFRLRFLLISAISLALALTAAGFMMIKLFEKNLERRVESELTNYVNQIAVELSFENDGKLKPPQNLVDRRFSLAYSGLYWQIDDATKDNQLRSRSLWDYALPLPIDTQGAGEIHRYLLAGPDNSTVIVEERQLLVATPSGTRPIRISAALDHNTITSARTEFAKDMIPYLLVLGAFLLFGSAIQMTLGLRPLKSIQSGLAAVRNKIKPRLEGKFPDEVKPLTQAINQLLDSQDETISRARKQAANLAHGLKTPLTVLTNDAKKLEAKGEKEIAQELLDLAITMGRHVDYELARSRITPEQSQRQSDGYPYTVVKEIVKTLQRVPNGGLIQWRVSVPENRAVKVDPEDLRELLGNIIENGLKWTNSTIIISGEIKQERFILNVEDDGPGLEPKLIDSVMQRGIRYDEKIPGTGIGLSLVQEICDINNIGMTIENRQSHGLSVTLIFEISTK